MSALVRYLLKRAADRFILVMVAIVVAFFLIRVVPIWYYGEDPFLLGLRLQLSPREQQAVIDALKETYGLDQPLFPNQFVKFITSMFTLNFGYSFLSRRPILEEIGERLPNTLALSIPSTIIIVLIGLILGWYSASKRGKMAESVVMQASIWSFVVPTYLMAVVSLIFLAYVPKVAWGITIFPLPPYTPPPLPSAKIPLGGFVVSIPIPTFDYIYYLSLPIISVVLAGFGGFAYYVRQLTVSELGQDYIVTAKAKGLDDQTIMRRHVFRNVTPPVVTTLTLSIPGLFGGLIISERIFSYYGMGLYIVQALDANDYPAVAAVFFLFTVITAIALYVVDILVALLDPRVRLRGR